MFIYGLKLSKLFPECNAHLDVAFKKVLGLLKFNVFELHIIQKNYFTYKFKYVWVECEQ